MTGRLRSLRRDIWLLCLLIFFTTVLTFGLRYQSRYSRLSPDVATSDSFRKQYIPENIEEQVNGTDDPGSMLAVYWLESDFGRYDYLFSDEGILLARKKWERASGWGEYVWACQAVWDDLEYYPVVENPENTRLYTTFEDSWMFDRSYGGERGHEGTDIMPSVNERGLFPVVSMTDGIVENKGWLELGGYRLGIRAPHGAYFYYAHLESYADLEQGDEIKAGQLIGFMGDSGYGAEEGTKGKFPVHLHIGVYLYINGKEVSVNPYPVLRYVSQKRVQGDFG